MNQQATLCDNNVAAGAKIGHGVNVLENSDLESYQNIVINLGLNNLNLNLQTDFTLWHSQLQKELERLKKQITTFASKGKNIRLISVPDAPVTKSTNQAKKMQNTVNVEIKKICDSICDIHKNSVKVVTVQIKSEEESFSDNVHFTEVQTAILLENIDESLPLNAKMIIRNRPKGVLLTTPRKYSRVNGTYKFGCKKCTQLGHQEDTCSLILEKIIITTKTGKLQEVRDLARLMIVAREIRLEMLKSGHPVS